MAGSSITNPRKSGSFKRLQGISGNGGLGQGSGGSPTGPSAPAPSKRSAPPGMVDPSKPQISNQQIKENNAQGSRNYAQAQHEQLLRSRIAAEGSVRAPQQIGRAVYTPDAPTYGTGASAAPQPVNNQTAGSGMVRNQGEQRGGDRTGIEVLGAGGTPIRVDNNQQIAGAATREQQQQIQNTDPNSVYSQPVTAAPVAASPVDANGNLIKPDLPTGPSQAEQNQQMLSGNVTALSDPLQSNRVNPPLSGTLPASSPRGSGIATSGAGLSPTGSSQQALTSSSAPSSTDGTTQASTTSSSSGENLPNPGGVWGPMWNRMSDQQKRQVLGLKDVADKAAEEAQYDEYVPTRYDTAENPINGNAIDKSGDFLHTANEVAGKYGMTKEQAKYLMDKGYVFYKDDDRIDTASGTPYTGSELKDMLSDNPTVQGNAQEGADDLAIFEKNKAEDELDKDAEASKEMAAADRAKVDELLNKPTDVSGVVSAFDRTIDAARQSAARNKALSLRGLQERGAYSGASVNQMMGQSTEAGYAYDTEAQQQEANLNLQKEMAIANAEKEDADRKLNWAVALYQRSSNKEEADANWIKVQKWQEISDAAGQRRARAEAEANSPGIGAYLAAGGIGVAGALGSIFSGGAAGVAALGAISSILGSAGAMYGMSNGSNVQMPATNFNYQSAPGSSNQSYQPIAGAPGSRDAFGKSATGNGSVRLGF